MMMIRICEACRYAGMTLAKVLLACQFVVCAHPVLGSGGSGARLQCGSLGGSDTCGRGFTRCCMLCVGVRSCYLAKKRCSEGGMMGSGQACPSMPVAAICLLLCGARKRSWAFSLC